MKIDESRKFWGKVKISREALKKVVRIFFKIGECSIGSRGCGRLCSWSSTYKL